MSLEINLVVTQLFLGTRIDVWAEDDKGTLGRNFFCLKHVQIFKTALRQEGHTLPHRSQEHLALKEHRRYGFSDISALTETWTEPSQAKHLLYMALNVRLSVKPPWSSLLDLNWSDYNTNFHTLFCHFFSTALFCLIKTWAFSVFWRNPQDLMVHDQSAEGNISEASR